MKAAIATMLLAVLCPACKPRVFKYEEYGNEVHGKKEWTIGYFASNPPRDTIERHKLVISYADSLGISLDSLKKTDIRSYAIRFKKYTLWTKVYELVMKKYPNSDANF